MNRPLTRAILFCAALCLGITGPLFAFVAVAGAYVLIYTGPELLLVGFVIDGYFTYGRTLVPYYTLGIAAALMLAQLIRPYISMYNR